MNSVTLLAAILSYQLPAHKPIDYDLRVQFEGMIPILGGNQGKADVRLGVRVIGLDIKDGVQRASSELTKADILFNDAKLPLSLENVQDFFPKTTIDFTPQGKILKTDAPDIQLPVRLPGLDVKRFPDISFMLLEFPEGEVKERTPWSFEKSFGGSPVKYTAALVGEDEKSYQFELTIDQSYTVFEDSAMQVVEKKEDAENEVETTMKATGTVTFSKSERMILKSEIVGNAKSVVKPIDKGEASERSLTIKVSFNRSDLKPAATSGVLPTY